MKKYVYLFILFLSVTPGLRPEGNISISGYFKNFSTVFFLPTYDTSGTDIKEPDIGAVSNRLRLNLSLEPASWLKLDTAVDLAPRIQDPSLFKGDIFFGGVEPASYRFDDFRSMLYPDPCEPVRSFGVFFNLDRLFFSIKTNPFDIFIGRQPISWGSARIINPTDVIAPFSFNDLDVEERRGVDAVRARIPLGMMDELDLGFIAGSDFSSNGNGYFLRGKFHMFQTDMSLLFLSFRKHLLIGMDISRSIGGAGIWLEAAYVLPYYFYRSENKKENNYGRISAGLDYNFSGKTYGFVEYHFNSAGKNRPEDYINVMGSSAFLDGSVYLMGKHYLGISLTYQVTPLLPFSSLFLFNLGDTSLTIAPQLEYNIAENIYVSAGAYIGVGKKPGRMIEFVDNPSPLFRSEFGTYPDMLFGSFRIYF